MHVWLPVPLNVFSRRHHCRSCSRVVCDACSGTRRPVPPVYNDPVRICDSCEHATAAALEEVCARRSFVHVRRDSRPSA